MVERIGAERILGELEGAGLVTYRDFADEYRIWQGTAVDVRASLESARARVQRLPLAGILADVDSPEPVVAARHSAKSDVLRVFRRRYVDSHESIEPLDTFSSYDGEVLLLISEKAALPSLERWRMTKPTVAAIPRDLSEVDAAAREVASIADVLAEPAVKEDWVARRELGERLAQAQAVLDEALARAFSSHVCSWILLGSGEGEDEELVGGRGSSAVSEAADHAYSESPRVRNEMLNRTELTSQGAKARSRLLGAMIDHGTEHDLSLEGHGPEVAMYRALLQSTRIHRRSDHRAEMVFAEPADPSLLSACTGIRRGIVQAFLEWLGRMVFNLSLSVDIGQNLSVVRGPLDGDAPPSRSARVGAFEQLAVAGSPARPSSAPRAAACRSSSTPSAGATRTASNAWAQPSPRRVNAAW